MKTLHLIDGSNWAARAYFAAAKLSSPSGQETGAIKQFTNMMWALQCKARDSSGGAYIAVAFDLLCRDSWRHRAIRQWVQENKEDARSVFKASLEYKGNRDRSKTQDLNPQIEIIIDILQMFGIKVFQSRTYECDDILGTLSDRFSRKCKVRLYSADKDFAQLVSNENVTLIRQKQGNLAERITTVDTVAQHFGVPHDQIVHKLALCGDGVDNVPGVPGIGEVTAIQLLKSHSTVFDIQKHASNVKGKPRWKKALLGEIPMMDLDLMLDLVTINRNVPKLPRKLEDLCIGESDDRSIKKIKRKLGFSRLFHL